MAASIVVVRHGETDWSATGKHTSRTDLPLNDDGRRRAAALRDQLSRRRFEVVLCSPLRRARETCELAGFGERATTCDELREWDYGEYEGMTTPEIRELRPDWDLWRDGCPEGETPAQISARADVVIERLSNTDEDALLFAHGHILRVLSARWIGYEPAAGEHLLLGAGSLGVLGYDRGTPVIDRWNIG